MHDMPNHLILDLIILLGEEKKLQSSLSNFLHPPVTLFLLVSNTSRSMPFSQTLSANLCSSLNVTKFSHMTNHSALQLLSFPYSMNILVLFTKKSY
jgi:hypothetical protein